jgi:hypothetical protein
VACISRGLRHKNPVKTNTKSTFYVADFEDLKLKNVNPIALFWAKNKVKTTFWSHWARNVKMGQDGPVKWFSMPCASIFQSQTSKNDKSFVVGHIYIYQTRADNEGHQERASDTSVAVSIAGSGRVVVSISGSGSVAVRIAGSGQKRCFFDRLL